MNFLEPIYKGGLADEIDRICNTTSAVYSNRDKVVRINEGINQYFAYGNYQFEDSNQTAAPIETINLVSGTGRYALSGLTSELLNFLRVEITDSGGNDFVIYSNRLSNISEAYDEYYKDNGVPAEYFKFGKYLDLKPTPNYSKTDGIKIYFDRPATQYTFVGFTVAAATDLFTATAHSLAAGDALIFETDTTIPAGITADTVVYYVIASGLTADVFKVSTTIGGSTIDVTDTGTGNHKYLKVSRSPGIPTIHHNFLARYASLPFLRDNGLKNYQPILLQLSKDEKEIKEYFNSRNKDERQVMSMAGISFR